MDTDRSHHEQFVKDEMAKRGLELTRSALIPFKEFPFEELHAIVDHEERFLQENLIGNIEQAHNLRVRDSESPLPVNARDIRTAMLMLGAAIAEAPPEVFSKQSLILKICPYCPD